ncbi:uncharacterized protein LOC127615927 [Hippocampus zosterae]|uniref:uncharacterized protein LOC127615927 n=1 Tax=Hippocampus zosterae TaxID=109293 RepID=UPI00223E0102|nr:uncharacterized protein LOC127615927 [Hippocampus zosterae]
MNKDKNASATFGQITAVLILACFLAHTVDSYRLKKADRRKYVPDGFRRGKIMFGKVPQWDPPMLNEEAKKSNASVEDDDAYQADSAGGWAVNPVPVQPPASQEASWRRMTSLQCGDSHMKLSVRRPGLTHMTVQQAPNAPPLPLPLVPLNCGYNMHRNSFGFLMYVPYGGCYMLQQAGSYVLPMYWQGVPVILMCTRLTPTDAPKVTSPFHLDQMATKGPDAQHVPKWPPVAQAPVSPLGIWAPVDPRSQAQSPVMSPRFRSHHSAPHVPKWPLFPRWPPMPHGPGSQPGLQKPPMPRDPMFDFGLQAPRNPFVSQYPNMPHMPYMHNLPRPYPDPQVMGQYPYFNPSLWTFPGHPAPAGNKEPKNPVKTATLSKVPTSIPPVQTTTTLPSTTTAPTAAETTPLPYNPLYQFPPELMHYISYEDLLAAMYANQ